MEQTIDEALTKGVEAHKAGQFQDADRHYTAILQAQPKHPDANHNMGVLAVDVGKLEGALPFFRAALEADPSIAQFWLSNIDAFIKLGAIDDAQNMLAQSKNKGFKGEAFSQVEQRINQLGKNSEHAGSDNDNSIESENNILDTKSLNQALRLAKIKSKDGSTDEVRRIYQNIIDRFPKNRKALIGMKALSAELIDKQVESQEPTKNQLQPLIDLYSRGQLQQASAQATQMLRQFPKSFTLYNILGAANAGLKKFDTAIDNYKQALKINPSHAEASYNMGTALSAIGDLDAAIDSFKQAINIKPGYADAYNNMGGALQDRGDLEAAEESFKQALKINPSYAAAYYNMANVLKDKGELDGAIDSFKQALKINPSFAEAYYNMGDALRDKGELEATIDCYKQALEIKPDFYDCKLNLIDVLTYYLPEKKEDTHPIVSANFEIRKITTNYESSKTISDNSIIKLFASGCKIIKVKNIEIKYPWAQIYRRNTVDLNCERHIAIFKRYNIIPEYCFGCYKVQVEPRNVMELMKLFVVFDNIKLPNDNI